MPTLPNLSLDSVDIFDHRLTEKRLLGYREICFDVAGGPEARVEPFIPTSTT